mgnify:CR=1 FL=1
METRGTILVVEEAPDVAGLIRDGLSREGYRTLVAPSIAAALDILAAISVRLVRFQAIKVRSAANSTRGSCKSDM